MEIVIGKPPAHIWERAKKLYDVEDDNVFFTYGDKLFNPGNREIAPHLMAHEQDHSRKQLAYPGGPDAWWERHFTDPAFRAEEEACAYGKQYAKYCADHKDRNWRFKFLLELSSALSSSLYSLHMSESDARTAIKHRAGKV